MFTVSELVTSYCTTNNLQPPTNKDFSNCGHLISQLFRETFNKQTDLGIIPEAGFIKILERGRIIVVCFYPDSIVEHATEVVEDYYKQKFERIKIAQSKKKEDKKPVEKPKRKRIPVVK